MKILVTGAAGFVGSALAQLLIRKDCDVDLIDNYYKPSNITAVENVKIQRADIRTIKDISKYDVLVHLAAISGIGVCEENKEDAFSVNIKGTFNLLRSFRGRVIFASTSAVYGQAETVVLDEKTPVNPRSFYGFTKLKGEELIQLLDNYCILRFSNIYGKGLSYKRTVVDLFIDNALKEKPLLIHGDGRQRRDFMHINDAIKAYWYAINSPVNDIFNVGGNEELNINELAEMVRGNCLDITGFNPEIKHIPLEGGNIWRDFTYNIDKAKKYLKFEPSYRMKDEIRNRLSAYERASRKR